MQELPHGLPLTQGGFLVSAEAPLKQELINCLRASPLIPLACALQSFIFCCCEVSCALTGAVNATKIAAATIYLLMSCFLPGRPVVAKAASLSFVRIDFNFQ